MQVITDEKEITPASIEKILRKNKSLDQVKVKKIKKKHYSAYTSKVCFIEVEYSEKSIKMAPKNLVLKMLRKEFGFPELGRKEVEFYKSIANQEEILPVIRCYGAEYDEHTERSHILLQDISESHFEIDYPLPPSYLNCEKFVEALAKLHVFWWDKKSLSEFKDEDFWNDGFDYEKEVQKLENIVERFLDFIGDRLSEQRKEILRDSIEFAIKYRWNCYKAGKNLTLCMGDSHGSNAFYPKDSSGTVLIGDWQNIHVFRGVADLAYFMGVNWFPEQRKRMELVLLQKYHGILMESGIKDYSWDECYDDYRAYIVVLLYILIEWQWDAVKIPAIVWLPNLERTFSAFEDLNCFELIEIKEKEKRRLLQT